MEKPPLFRAGVYERIEQALHGGVCVAEPLRVPLDAEAEPCVRLFNGLHDAVLAQRSEGEAGGDPVHGLRAAISNSGAMRSAA